MPLSKGSLQERGGERGAPT